MSKSAQIVERAAALAGSKTALAKELDVSLNQVSDWIHERKKVPDSALAICAAMDGNDPLEVLAKERGGRWEKVAKLAAGAALSVFLTGTPPPSNASPATQFITGGLYIMSNRRRWNPHGSGVPALV